MSDPITTPFDVTTTDGHFRATYDTTNGLCLYGDGGEVLRPVRQPEVIAAFAREIAALRAP